MFVLLFKYLTTDRVRAANVLGCEWAPGAGQKLNTPQLTQSEVQTHLTVNGSPRLFRGSKLRTLDGEWRLMAVQKLNTS